MFENSIRSNSELIFPRKTYICLSWAAIFQCNRNCVIWLKVKLLIFYHLIDTLISIGEKKSCRLRLHRIRFSHGGDFSLFEETSDLTFDCYLKVVNNIYTTLSLFSRVHLARAKRTLCQKIAAAGQTSNISLLEDMSQRHIFQQRNLWSLICLLRFLVAF